MTFTLVLHFVDDLHTCATLCGWPLHLCCTAWMTFTTSSSSLFQIHLLPQTLCRHSWENITITLNVYHFDNLNSLGNYIHNIEEFLWTTGIHVFSNSWSLCTWVLCKIAIVVSSRNRPCWNLNVVITSTHLIMKSPQYTHSEATMSSSSACRWRKENWYSIRYTVIQ